MGGAKSLNVNHPANNIPDERSDEHVVKVNIAVAQNIPVEVYSWKAEILYKHKHIHILQVHKYRA